MRSVPSFRFPPCALFLAIASQVELVNALHNKLKERINAMDLDQQFMTQEKITIFEKAGQLFLTRVAQNRPPEPVQKDAP